MKLSLFVATALAVGSSSIVALAESGDRAPPVVKIDKADRAVPAKQAAPAKAAKTAPDKVAKAARSTKAATIAAPARASQRIVDSAKNSKGKPRLVAKARKSKVVIDTMTTASVAMSAKSTRAYGAIVSRHAAANGVPASLAHAVITVESNYRVDALGQAGEIGLMQIKPSTARMLGYTGSAKGLYNPETNIKYGLKYLGMAHKLGGGNTCGTILRYNAGHAATRMNPISAAYCSKVKRQLGG